MFHFVYADEEGNGYIDEDYFALGLLGAQFVEPSEEEVIPLPEGASLTMIPNRAPVVIDDNDQFVLYPGEGWVMGALLPQGYTRTLLPAFVNRDGADGLPLFGYAAVFAQDGELYVAAVPTDEDYKWNPQYFNTADLAARVEALQRKEYFLSSLGGRHSCVAGVQCPLFRLYFFAAQRMLSVAAEPADLCAYGAGSCGIGGASSARCGGRHYQLWTGLRGRSQHAG